jgi:hypothetical protein
MATTIPLYVVVWDTAGAFICHSNVPYWPGATLDSFK